MAKVTIDGFEVEVPDGINVVEAAKAAGANVILVLAVVDREEGAAEFFAQQNMKFDSLFKAGAFLAA